MVPGEGPQPSFGMIVGEAPGQEEVDAGRPFVGRSGKLLTTVLLSLGIDRAQVYITNAVKELPTTGDGKIRRPYDQEVEQWLPILQGEIEACAPAALLALGRTAQRALVPGVPAGAIPFGSIIGNVYIAWHPAYVLRQGGWLRNPPRVAFDEWLRQIRPWAEEVKRHDARP